MTVRAAAITGLSALCRSYGVDASDVLRAAALDPWIEGDPDRRVPVMAVNRAFELAAIACGRDDFGLRLAQLRGLSNLGPIGLVARDEPTIGAALGAIQAYLPLHNDALVTTRERHGDIVILRSDVRVGGARTQATDVAVAMQHRILSQLAGRDWQAEEVCLTRPRPSDPSRFRQVLGPNVRFEAEFDGIVILADLLDRPNPLADAAMRPYASQVLKLASAGSAESLAERVRKVLSLLLASGKCTASHVAAQLGTSRRSLTRGLAAEGTSFMDLLNEARRGVVERQLSCGARSIAEIADLVGFSSSAAFATWHRLQFGTTPGDRQRRARGARPDLS
ncbi:MAG: AraC family transcriptional regulator [Sphingomonadales bacterium]|nr:AraC family transcriptional regulator [Sphingomonadales bacterium]